jgi:hypothetical protein
VGRECATLVEEQKWKYSSTGEKTKGKSTVKTKL